MKNAKKQYQGNNYEEDDTYTYIRKSKRVKQDSRPKVKKMRKDY